MPRHQQLLLLWPVQANVAEFTRRMLAPDENAGLCRPTTGCHVAPGPRGKCGSRAAAPARDFDQRSSDDNVPVLIEKPEPVLATVGQREHPVLRSPVARVRLLVDDWLTQPRQNATKRDEFR
jgi:hypothetical protein